MKLSPNFSLHEFLRSQTAARHGIDMTPPDDIIKNLEILCLDFLEPLRIECNAPINISSGFRPLELNTAIGGSTTSSHMFGEAVDFTVVGYKPYSVCRIIRDLDFDYDQNINEFGQWTHLGVGPRKRRENLTAYKENKVTKYAVGIYRIKDLT